MSDINDLIGADYFNDDHIDSDEVTKQIIVKYYYTNKLLFTNSYEPNYLVASIKKNIERYFNIPFVNIVLKVKDLILENDDKIGDFECDSFGILEVTIDFMNVNLKLEPEDVSQMYQHVPPVLPDVLTVQVGTEDRGVYTVVVEVENKAIYKPNLGGYKNVFSGVEYHNAYSQTGPNLTKKLGFFNHRDTQTPKLKNKKVTRDVTVGTQVSALPDVGDKILKARPYETAEDREKRLDVPGKVSFLQKCLRAWILKRRVKDLSAKYRRFVKEQDDYELREKIEDEERVRQDLVDKAFPVNPEDFEMLFGMIERWKKAEIQRIVANYCGAAKIVEFKVLLDKEIELLHSIDKVRQKAADDLETKKVVKFFKTIGMPVKWTSNYKDLNIEMDTLQTQKGREYFRLYKALCDDTLKREEKLALYVDIKKNLENHKCPTVTELNKLLDRIIAILARNMDKNHYLNIEQMIQKLMFHHFQEPQCNEGVTARLLKEKKNAMDNKLLHCNRCNTQKTIDKFVLNARMNKINICKACNSIDKTEDPLADLSPYKFILKQVRRFETEHHGNTSVAFLVTVNDIYHIIDNIWHKKSALSECSDIYQLRLVRWNLKEQWSPWNCIPLTNEEAKLHVTVKNLDDVYSSYFISVVVTKLALAKIQFKHLTNISIK